MTLTVPGIDVSGHQDLIDWKAVAGSGKRYVWAKASENAGFADPYYQTNHDGALSVGMLFGAYHFLHHGNISAQVLKFMTVTRQLAGCTLPYLLDAEIAGVTTSDIEQFVELVDRDHVLYLGQPAHGQIGTPPVAWSKWPLMYPDYRTTQPAAPTPWPHLTVWQSSSVGKVPGINGSVDLSTADQAWIQSLSPTPPPPPTFQEGDMVFVTYPDNGNQTWFVTDGVTGRPVSSADAQTIQDLGLITKLPTGGKVFTVPKSFVDALK